MTLSSTESEAYTAVEAAKDIIYFRNALAELGFPIELSSPLWVDNKSLIELATRFSGNHKRVRHFLVRIHFLVEQVKQQTISMEYVDTTANTADQLTKPLTGMPFLLGRQSLMGPQRTKATVYLGTNWSTAQRIFSFRIVVSVIVVSCSSVLDNLTNAAVSITSSWFIYFAQNPIIKQTKQKTTTTIPTIS